MQVVGNTAEPVIKARSNSTGSLLTLTDSVDTLRFVVSNIGIVTTGVWNGTPVSAPYGGTGRSSYNTGDILYASSSNTLTTLGIGSNNNVLVSNGSVPVWSQISFSNLSGVLPVSKGGTNTASFSPNSVIISASDGLSLQSITSVSNAVVTFNASGTPTTLSGGGPYTYLTTGTGNSSLQFSSIDLSNGVGNSILKVANGGTGISTIPQYSFLYGSGNNVSLSTLTSSTTSVLTTSATGAPQYSLGTVANRILRTDGTSISFSQLQLSTDVAGVLPLNNGGTNASLVPVVGGIVYSDNNKLNLTSNSSLVWDSINNRLGINTASPASYLDVNGNVIIRNGLAVLAGESSFAAKVTVPTLSSNTAITSGGVISAVGNIIGSALISNSTIYGVTLNSTGLSSVGSFISNSTAIINGTTDSTSSLTGALTVAGGVGIAKTLYVGNSAYIGGNLTVAGNLIINGNVSYVNSNVAVIEDPSISIGTGPNGTPLTSIDLYDRGLEPHYYSAGADRYGFVGWQNSTGRFTYIANATGGLTSGIYSGPLGDAQFGNIIIGSSNNSPLSTTSTTTGALVITGTGGIGIGGSLNAGGYGYFATGTNTSGASIVNSLTSNTSISGASISSTGSVIAATLIANVSAQINGSLTSTGTITAQSIVSNSGVTFSNVTSIGNIVGANIIANSGVSGATISASGSITGSTLVANSSVTSPNIIITGPATTVSNTTGALVVTGGIATSNNLYVSGSTWTGNISVTSTTSSTSNTTGALTVAGGVGVSGDIFAASFRPTSSTIPQRGMYAPATNVISLSTNTLERFRIDSNGNVGISTSTPTAYLDINTGVGIAQPFKKIRLIDYTTTFGFTGSIPAVETIGSRGTDANTSFFGRFAAGYRRADGNVTTSNFRVGGYLFGGQAGNSTVHDETLIGYPASIEGLSLGNWDSVNSMPTGLLFKTGIIGSTANAPNANYGTERMRIDQYGNVMIGTSTSAFSTNGRTVLTVGSTTSAMIALQQGGVDRGFITSNNTDINISSNTGNVNILAQGTEKVRITSDGKVGIGTSTPTNSIDIVNNGAGNAPFLTLRNTNGTASGAYGPGVILNNGLAGHGFIIQQQHANNGPLTISNPSTPFDIYLTISQSGYIGIGPGTYPASQILDVGGSVLFRSNAAINSTTVSTSSSTGALVVAGGAGIGGALNVGNIISATSIQNTPIGTITPAASQFTSVISQNTLIAGSIVSNSYINSNSINSTSTISAVGKITGALIESNSSIVTSTLQSSSSIVTDTFVANTSVTTATLTSTGTATLNQLVVNSSIDGNTFLINGASASTATTGTLVIDTFSTSVYRTTHYIVQVTDNTNSSYYSAQLMLIHNGASVWLNEYNVIYTTGILGTFDAIISAGNVQLTFSPTVATNKTIKVVRTSIDV